MMCTMNGTTCTMSGGMMVLMWITYVLVVALLVLGIVALWKYISKR
jgi:hypothetical protein